jgi:hypothetical protein
LAQGQGSKPILIFIRKKYFTDLVIFFKLDYIAAGVFKLFTLFIWSNVSCIIGCTIGVGDLRKRGDKRNVCYIIASVLIGIFVILCGLCNTIWYMVDWIRILTDDFKDGNGVTLKNW